MSFLKAMGSGGRILVLYLLLALVPVVMSWWLPAIQDDRVGPGVAWADDDDDDDDDDSPVPTPPVNLAVTSVDGGDVVQAEVLGIELSRSQISQVLQRGFSIIRSETLGQSGFSYNRFRAPEGLSEAQAVALLNAEVAQQRFDFNHVYRLTQASCSGQRCVDRRLVAWPLEQTGRCRVRARIGMIDTAVSPMLAGVPSNRLTRRSFHGGTGRSDTDHGSAVAALLAGQEHGRLGLLPDTELLAADVFSERNDGELATSAAAMAEAMDWLMARQAQVINISVAGPDNLLLRRSVETAARRGVIVVASAGNDGPRARPAFPAAYPQTLAVTAVDARRRLYADANRGDHITLAAPGVSVFVPTAGEGAYRTGTSFAAPFVTASVAVLQARGLRDQAEIEKALQETVIDLGARGRDPLFGWGLLRAPDPCP